MIVRRRRVHVPGAGDLITKKRNRLATRTANVIMCLRYWLHMPEAPGEEKPEYNRRQLEEDSRTGSEGGEQLLADCLGGASAAEDEEMEL
jgi:hypothetical protein